MKTPSPRTDSGTPNIPPAVSVIEIRDPTTVGEAIEEIEQSAVQLESSPLRVRRVIVRLGACVVLFQSTNRAVRTRTVVQEGVVAFVAFGPRAVGTMNGLPVGPDKLAASTPGVEVMFVVEAGYESVTFLVPPADIRSIFAVAVATRNLFFRMASSC